MTRASIAIPVTLLALLSLSSCQQKKSEAPRTFERATDRPNEYFFPPAYSAFRDMTVHGIENMPDSITLVDGKWEDAAGHKTVTLVRDIVAFGDVTHDGRLDAIVLLGASYGGTGDIIHLAVVSKQGDGARNVATAVIGDRVQVRGARLNGDGRIVLDVVQAGPHDAMCCPGETAERIWQLDGGVLREVPSSAPPGRLSLTDLEGPTWLLHYWDRDEEASLLVAIQFQGGVVFGTSGCNQYHAEVRTGQAPGDIRFVHVTHTLMACGEPKDSVETRFLSQLNGVTKFSFVATELALTYRIGDKIGTMRFLAPKL